MASTKKSPTRKRARTNKPAASVSATVAHRDATGTTRPLSFDLKGKPAKDRVEPREGTNRRRMLDALREKPRSFDDLHRLCGFGNRRSTYDGARLLARVSGYALSGNSEAIKLA
jgi:hypothetical protein